MNDFFLAVAITVIFLLVMLVAIIVFERHKWNKEFAHDDAPIYNYNKAWSEFRKYSITSIIMSNQNNRIITAEDIDNFKYEFLEKHNLYQLKDSSPVYDSDANKLTAERFANTFRILK